MSVMPEVKTEVKAEEVKIATVIADLETNGHAKELEAQSWFQEHKTTVILGGVSFVGFAIIIAAHFLKHR